MVQGVEYCFVESVHSILKERRYPSGSMRKEISWVTAALSKVRTLWSCLLVEVCTLLKLLRFDHFIG